MTMHEIILLVEDDGDDQHLFIEALHSIYPAIECIIASNGRDAIEKLDNRRVMTTTHSRLLITLELIKIELKNRNSSYF